MQKDFQLECPGFIFAYPSNEVSSFLALKNDCVGDGSIFSWRKTINDKLNESGPLFNI